MTIFSTVCMYLKMVSASIHVQNTNYIYIFIIFKGGLTKKEEEVIICVDRGLKWHYERRGGGCHSLWQISTGSVLLSASFLVKARICFPQKEAD